MKRSVLLGKAGMACALLFYGSVMARADDPAAIPPVANAPAAPVTDVSQVASHYRNVLARPEFHDTSEPDISSRFKDYLTQWFMRLGTKIGEFKYASRIPAVESLLMTLLVGFAMAGLFYIMLRLRRRRIGMEEEFSSRLRGMQAPRAPEFFAEAIRDAVKRGEWRTAWLVAWRQFLARLESGQLIEPDRTQTNREYLCALRARALPPPALALLGALVESYDRAIYGRQPIAEADWNVFHGQLDEAALLLHLEHKSRADVAFPSS